MPPAPRAPPRRSAAVIAIGASAGGLESLGELLEGLPRGLPAPVLAVLHLDPRHRSLAVPLLQRRTALRVVTATGGVAPRAGHVYVAPPDRHLQVRAGRLRLSRGARVNHSRPSVDTLLASVAAEYGPAAVGIVLSGAGRDGAVGLAAVKARGGLTLAEDPATARFGGMPEAAARAGGLDAVLPAGQMPAFLLRALGTRVPVSDRQWSRMLALLQARTGTRFSRYRSSTLHRRLQHRLAATGSRTMSAYLRRLEGSPAEAAALKAAFLIKVTSFRRDPVAWRALEREVLALPDGAGHGIRAWSAGCATGEEAYSLAMLLARRFGAGEGAGWKVYGTDVDDAALKVARSGRFTAAQAAGIRKDDLARHFVRDGTAWLVRKALRGHLVFGNHDLLRDPPLPGIDVLACRNVLIYFGAAERERALGKLCSVVTPHGILFLGKSEGARAVPGFARIGRTTLFRRMPVPAPMTGRKKAGKAPPARAAAGRAPAGQAAAAQARADAKALEDSLADSSAVATLATDLAGRVRLWNRAAEGFFGRGADQAIGQPLAKAVGADAARRLRAGLNAPRASRVELDRDTDDGPRRRAFECLPAAAPLAAVYLGTESPMDGASQAGLAGPTGRDARPRHRTAESRMRAQQSLNEELQSRNEELETVNEELQSLNDELSTMEEQIRDMAEESRLNSEFLRLLLDSSTDALIACDAENRVAFWSKSAVKRFRLSDAQAVGGELFDLVPALDERSVRDAARKVRQPGQGRRAVAQVDGMTCVFEALSAGPGTRRGYLLRVRSRAVGKGKR